MVLYRSQTDHYWLHIGYWYETHKEQQSQYQKAVVGRRSIGQTLGGSETPIDVRLNGY